MELFINAACLVQIYSIKRSSLDLTHVIFTSINVRNLDDSVTRATVEPFNLLVITWNWTIVDLFIVPCYSEIDAFF